MPETYKVDPKDHFSRPDLCPLACLERISRFMEDETDRMLQFARNDEGIAVEIFGALRIRDRVNELIADMTRTPGLSTIEEVVDRIQNDEIVD